MRESDNSVRAVLGPRAMTNGSIALALRSTLFSPDELLEFTKLADGAEHFRAVFFPDISASYDSIELGAAALAVTDRIKAGSGVLRPLEHDADTIARRLATVQFTSHSRFIFGIGTGKPSPTPGKTIDQVMERVDQVRQRFESEYQSRGLSMPDVYMAALRRRVAERTIKHVDGLILNFCSAQYAHDLVSKARSRVESSAVANKTFACYLKIFYSADDRVAKELLISEFKGYDANPQYHDMFVKNGVAEDISNANSTQNLPESLAKISLANPAVDQLQQLVDDFRSGGVDLPCIYPYFAPTDSTEFKLRVAGQIMKVE